MMLKLMIADDEQDIVQALAELLEGYGFEVCSTTSPDDFEQVFLRSNPDLIMLDICFGSQSGPDVYDRAMKNPSAPKTPVIFLSGLVDSHSQTPLIKGRQVALYAKPVNVEQLAKEIQLAFADTVAKKSA